MMRLAIVEILITFFGFITYANAQCEFTSPGQEYKASWYLDPSTKMVHFKLSSTQRTPGGYWTGIGFGAKMQGGDFIIVTSANNQVSVSDRTGIGYTQPIEDREQDVKGFTGRLENGVIQAEFSRAVVTGDARDLPIIDKAQGNCQQFIFPVSGGSATDNVVHKHTATPTVQKICNIEQCPPFSSDGSGAAGTGTPTSGGSPDQTTPRGTEAGGASNPTDGQPAGTTGGSEAGGATTRGNRPTEEYQTTSSPIGTGNSGVGTGGGVGVGGASASDSDCSFKDGDYSASWTYDKSTQSVKFTISAPLALNKWTGIGFGQSMQGGDMIVIYDANGVVNISDRHGVGHVEPLTDARQDVTGFQNTYNGNSLQAQFSRRVNTGDVDDLPLEDSSKNNCQYFMFPVHGGPINAGQDGKITLGIHTETPKTKLICKINACGGGGGAPGTVTQQPTVGGGAGTSGGGSQPPIGGTVEGRPCPPRDDHSACKNYIDDYLNVVYSKFPKTDPITQKACGLLQTHQNGIVYVECCHYLSQSQTCGRFIGGGGGQPTPQQPQPTSAGGNPAGATGTNQPPPQQTSVNGQQQPTPTAQNQPQPAGNNNQPENRPFLPSRQNPALGGGNGRL